MLTFQINWYKPDTVLPVQQCSISIIYFVYPKSADEGLTALQCDDTLFRYFTTLNIYEFYRWVLNAKR